MIVIMSHNFIEKLIAKADSYRTLRPGEVLFRQDDPVRSIFIVEKGLVELVRFQPNGFSITLQRANNLSVLAEASLYSKYYHCDAIIKAPSCISVIKKEILQTILRQDEYFSMAWSQWLAKEVQSARSQIDILSRKTVAERLDGWLGWQGEMLPSKGQWKDIASQIGVSPEALYREIAKRRAG